MGVNECRIASSTNEWYHKGGRKNCKLLGRRGAQNPTAKKTTKNAVELANWVVTEPLYSTFMCARFKSPCQMPFFLPNSRCWVVRKLNDYIICDEECPKTTTATYSSKKGKWTGGKKHACRILRIYSFEDYRLLDFSCIQKVICVREILAFSIKWCIDYTCYNKSDMRYWL